MDFTNGSIRESRQASRSPGSLAGYQGNPIEDRELIASSYKDNMVDHEKTTSPGHAKANLAHYSTKKT
jgi:hypothetical protein